MSDTYDPTTPRPPGSIFWGNAKPGSPLSYEALQTRRKIAEALLGQGSPYPRNVGEGIASLGESIGGAIQLSRLEEQEQQSAAREAGVRKGLFGGEPTPPTTAATPAPDEIAAGAPREAGPPVSNVVPSNVPLTPAFTGPGYARPGGRDAIATQMAGVPLPPPRPVYDRNPQLAELQDNPVLADRIRTIAKGESNDPREQQIIAETIFNRAAARGQQLYQVTRQYTGPQSTGYYPASTFGRGQISEDALTPVLRGSDIGGGDIGFSPTGNASEDVAANGIRTGRYNASGRLPGSGETFVQQEPPGQLQRLAATRVPANSADVQAAPPDVPQVVASLNPAGAQSDTAPAPQGSALPDPTAIAAAPEAVRNGALTPPAAATTGPALPPDPTTIAKAPGPGQLPPNMAGATLPPPVVPYDPGPEPKRTPPTQFMQRLERAAQDPTLSPALRQSAHDKYSELFKAQHEEDLNRWKIWKQEEIKSRDPATRLALQRSSYDVEKEKRALEGEGFFALSPEETARLGTLPAGVTAYKDRFGNLKTIQGPTTVSIDQAGEKEESKVTGRLAAERAGKMMESANTAGTTLYTLNRADALLNQIKTDALAPTRMSVGAMGRALGVSDEVLARLNLDPKSIGSAQAFNAIVGDLVIGKIGAGGSPSNNFSNTDRTFLTDTVAKLGDDPESNRIKLGAAKMVAHRDLEKAQESAAFRRDNPNKSFVDFEHSWNEKVSNNDLSGQLRQQAEALIATAKGGGDDAAREWLKNNPNDPRAGAIRKRLEGR